MPRRAAVSHHLLKLILQKEPVLKDRDFAQQPLVSFVSRRLQIIALKFLKQGIPVRRRRAMYFKQPLQDNPALVQLSEMFATFCGQPAVNTDSICPASSFGETHV